MNSSFLPPFVCAARALIGCAVAGLTATLALAQSAIPAAPAAADEDFDPDQAVQLDTFTIIGSKQNVERVPGAGVFLDADQIRTFAYDDINQVIRRAPGVYIRQEDGYGLFPNVSLRGVSTTRNAKVTIMEDGILMAPAPYADPAAYYTPNAGRMSALEILKGSSQIKYGPETTGGVINYLSTPIPGENSGRLAFGYGSDDDIRIHASYGGRVETGWASIGFLVEDAYRRTDGFKRIDATPSGAYRGSDRTGFSRNEPLAKLRLTLKTAVPQSLEFNYGRTDIRADETYLGLTDADFRADPHRRYAASRHDRIDTEQERYALRYTIQPTRDLAIAATLYRTEFARNWYKLDAAGEGASGAFRNLGEALAGQHGDGIIAVLKGEAAGRLRVRANNREYGAEGIDTVATWHLDSGDIAHRFELGVRWHEDFGDRFQWDDIYTQAADGSTTRTTAGVPGTQENRRGEAEALAIHLQDRIGIGALTITPGIRLERIEYTDIRRSTAPATLNEVTSVRRRTIETVAPGIGATWQQSEQLTWLAGVHRGISPPGPSATGGVLEEETSLGFEAGLRFNNRADFSAEVIAFHTAFDDLIVEQNAGGGGGVGQTSNIGKVNTSGLEVALAYDPSVSRQWSFRNPWHLSLTWTRARLGNDVNATGNSGGVVESIFSGGRRGNELPYIPEYQIALGTGIETGRWGVYLDGYHQPRTWASANNSPLLLNPDANAAAGLQPALDSRYGRVDAFVLVDLAVHYRLNDRTRLKVAVTNLLDWEYISSRVPIGPRPGPPRTWLVGVDTRF